ncbi:MAG TPA: LD-carboxypeptidase [Gemmatimonadaceae bacterium]|nr:LD-carboxypeptidase [Gemmatimonadaceae bacterium]
MDRRAALGVLALAPLAAAFGTRSGREGTAPGDAAALPTRAPVASITPPPLARGARVALVAPASPLGSAKELDQAVANVHSFGWEPVVGEHALAKTGYLAGSDAQRAADLNGAIRDPSINAIWCLRGGYGVMRILEMVDYDALRRRPKTVIGYSDITALHLAIRVRCGVVSYHGPAARETITSFSRASLLRAVTQNGEPCGVAPEARVLRSGSVRGPVLGGNLSLVASLVGTPFAAQLDGAILVLEEVDEPAYRVDRMLTQLRLSGALGRCVGLVFGAITPRGKPTKTSIRLRDAVLSGAAGDMTGPCMAGVPVGHIPSQWTVPMGALAELDAGARRLSLTNLV